MPAYTWPRTIDHNIDPLVGAKPLGDVADSCAVSSVVEEIDHTSGMAGVARVLIEPDGLENGEYGIIAECGNLHRGVANTERDVVNVAAWINHRLLAGSAAAAMGGNGIEPTTHKSKTSALARAAMRG